jgi:hypothetical protein
MKQTQQSAPKDKPLIVGLAKCIFNECMEDLLELNEVVFIQEIPNMRDHCIIFRNNKNPLVGYDIHRFRLMDDDEDTVTIEISEDDNAFAKSCEYALDGYDSEVVKAAMKRFKNAKEH